MSDYPPGTFGEQWDNLDAKLAEVEQNARGPLGWLVRRKARRARVSLAVYRRDLRRQGMHALIDQGVIDERHRETVDRL